ncbi:chromosome segregation protein SMC [Marinilactibacillus psychrotolerans]|uniref:Chromosome segregation protein SMC n=1 Tax=Marinilactibacillus psychrotolerans TaxID=191770 RepID=A0A5R9C2W4_9LACT|nr:ATP-binding protein [Marinilactibacillus psychrotolerans]TLQ07077.1 chromosome segregation protein SMC [Marinilactibacillus psychrotolerans]
MSTKIAKLEIENVKRVKALKIEPTAKGLTIVGGKNGQGKTSVLDSIAWALGGERKRPSDPERQGSVNKPYLKLTMSNGLEVERKGKNSDLKVVDPSGNKAGQQLLNSFVEELAIDLPRFMDATNKEKADTLLKIIGVGEKLALLEKDYNDVYNQRRTIGQISTQKEKYAAELPYYPDVPEDFLSASDLINQQQEILARNGENQQKRQRVQQYQAQHQREAELITAKKAEIERLQQELSNLEQTHLQTTNDLHTAQKTAEQLQDESTEELAQSIASIEEVNDKIRTNQSKDMAEEDARNYKKQYDQLSTKIDDIRKNKADLLDKADLPLPGLSVQEGELTYNGMKWDNMSGAEQLKVSTAIVRKLKPDCGFILIDKLEQMDLETLQEFGQWLEQEDLQAIATRVSTGEECSIIIENGEAVGQGEVITPISEATPENNAPSWKGEF